MRHVQIVLKHHTGATFQEIPEQWIRIATEEYGKLDAMLNSKIGEVNQFVSIGEPQSPEM